MSLYHSYRLLVFGRSRGGAGKYYVFQRATHTHEKSCIYIIRKKRVKAYNGARTVVTVAIVLSSPSFFVRKNCLAKTRFRIVTILHCVEAAVVREKVR